MKAFDQLPRISRVEVRTPEGDAGTLGNERGSPSFTYRPEASAPQQEVGLLMPARLAPYTGGMLTPLFSMNLPEGFLLEQCRTRLENVARVDPLLLLGITGDAHPIGRLAMSSDALETLRPGRAALASRSCWSGTAPRVCSTSSWTGTRSDPAFPVSSQKSSFPSSVTRQRPS